MKKEKYIFTYDMLFMNVVAFLLIGVMVLVSFIIFGIFDIELNISLDFSSGKYFVNMFSVFILIFLWMVLHEIIHGTFYILNCADRKNIFYGAALEKGIFYCKCGEFVTKKNKMISVIAPFVLIGVVTYILGIIINSPLLIILSVFNISGAAGDLTMFCFFLKRYNDIKFKEIGDSSTFCLETSEDFSNKKFLGVKMVKKVTDKHEIEEPRDKKITITKGSWGFIIFMGIILVLNLLIILFI